MLKTYTTSFWTAFTIHYKCNVIYWYPVVYISRKVVCHFPSKCCRVPFAGYKKKISLLKIRNHRKRAFVGCIQMTSVSVTRCRYWQLVILNRKVTAEKWMKYFHSCEFFVHVKYLSKYLVSMSILFEYLLSYIFIGK